MRQVLFLNAGQIGLIAGIAAAVVIGVFVILYFTLFATLRYRRQVRELIRKFEYLHALLFGQDAQYITRIEQISATNLLYADTNRVFAKRFRDVRDRSDSAAQSAINHLKDLLNERNYKELKEALPDAKRIIDAFDSEVNTLHNDLLAVIKPEEECRQEIYNLKETLRRIKQDYFVKQADLSLVVDSFEKAFSKLDERFTRFESLIDSADYEEAKDMIPQISKIIDSLGKALADLPNICLMIQTIIPDKLVSLNNAYQEMVNADYPLHHLLVISSTEEINRQIDAITDSVRSFALAGVQEALDDIVTRIDDFMEAFEKEKDARVAFESQIEEVNAKSAETDRRYIALCNALPSITKMYAIPDDEQAKIDAIKEAIEKAGHTKRSLDTLVHSMPKQPYSFQLERMNQVDEETTEASALIDAFYHYLISLRTDSENALKSAKEYYAKCRDAESMLRAVGIPSLLEKYHDQIEDCFEDIDKIISALHAPINVAYVNACVDHLVNTGDAVYGAIAADYDMSLKSQAAITYANRKRQHLGEVHSFLNQQETVFWDGELEKCYKATTDFIRQLREQE